MRRRRLFGRPDPPDDVPPDDSPPDELPPDGPGDVAPDEEVTRVARPRAPRAAGEIRDVRDTREVRTVRRPVRPPERNPWPWLLALLLLVLGGLAAAYFLTRDDEDEPVTVPAVVGAQRDAATSELRQAGLRPRVQLQFAARPRGTVVRQEPAAGVRVLRDSAVTLFVSRGPSLVAVPNLRGLTEAAAASELTAAGLEVSVFRVPSTQRPGTVIAQQPLPNERVQRGERVRINDSQGRTATTTVVTPTTTVVTDTT